MTFWDLWDFLQKLNKLECLDFYKYLIFLIIFLWPVLGCRLFWNAPESVILNKDIGFVENGMSVSLKIDTFDFQKYGMIEGSVTQISKDSIMDEKLGPVYKMYVKPLKAYLLVNGKKMKIQSGMTLTAEVNVGKRRIIEFFIYPLIKYLDEGMSVR